MTDPIAAQKWQYMRFPVIPRKGGPNVAALDNLGEEGWELVCYVPDSYDLDDGQSGYLLFKRAQLADQKVDDRAFRGALFDPRGPDPRAAEL